MGESKRPMQRTCRICGATIVTTAEGIKIHAVRCETRRAIEAAEAIRAQAQKNA